MDKITQVLFSDIGKVTLNMLKYHTRNLNRTKCGLRLCSMGYAVRICMF